jgi:hypothetical protein
MKRTDQTIGYVYKHIRKDTNEVFYIGIGKTEKRAYNKICRNSTVIKLTRPLFCTI